MQGYTDAERGILTARSVEVSQGLELLDTNDQWIADASDQLIPEGSSVKRSNYAAVHGTCDLQLTGPALDWPTVRVRPWLAVSSPAGTVRRNLGVYLLTTPERTATDDDVETYAVQGFDKLTLLQRIVGDTYVVPAGTGYLDAVRQAITDSGVTGLPPLLDGSASGLTLAQPFVWCLDEADPATWLRVVNDLLAAVGYRGLWADQDGRYRSEPYQTPLERAPEWTFDLKDQRTNIVGPVRKLTADNWSGLNYWRFVQDGQTVRPTEGSGLYTVDRVQPGELRRARVERLQVADQASLEARAEQLIDADTQRQLLVSIEAGPLPVLGHFDLTRLVDPELGDLRVLTRQHTIPLDGQPAQLDLEVVAG